MSRADLHCHSSASEVSKLGVQRALGLPECATPPEEVYALAKSFERLGAGWEGALAVRPRRVDVAAAP